jgi:POT family proton-dependent oligopeptide transporter
MLAIFVLYLQENFGWNTATVTNIYGIFLALVYFTPIVGGWVADNLLGYGKTIILGAITMGIGYALMAVPTDVPTPLYIALAVVIIGNGLFKANISVLVGNLYAHKDSSLKDAAYNIFYMGINIGAFYAPQAASGIKNFFVENLDTSLAVGYNAGFGVAAAGMLLSLLTFTIWRKHYKSADYQSKHQTNTEKDEQIPKSQEKERIVALLIVFAIVIFFWMAFHQNGASLTLLARDYVDPEVSKFTYLLFDFLGLHGVLAILIGGAFLFSKNSKPRTKAISGSVVAVGVAIIVWKVLSYAPQNEIYPEQFAYFNPMFIILITPLVVGTFSLLHKRGKEPSSPGKIGIGMVLTGLSFLILMFATIGLPAVHTLGSGSSSITISPFWLISTYFVVTIGELHLSPMGLSFVSKTAPPKMKGLMMGLWFGATAIGNYLSGFIGRFYENWELWQFFLMLVITSFIGALLIRLFLKKLKHATR